MSTLFPVATKTTPNQIRDSFRVIKKAIDKWRYADAEYREYGLYHDDLYNDKDKTIAKAVSRLPEDLFTARMHRHHRAGQLSLNKIMLPESMWPKIDDPMHYYLKPYIDELEKDQKERQDWDKK